MNEKKLKKKSIAPIILSVLLILTLISYLIVAFGNQFNWFESFRNNDDQPYGTEVFYSLLSKSVGQENCFIWGDSLNPPPNEKLLYVFIGNYPYLDSVEVQEILKLSENGNEVFLSTRRINPLLLLELFPAELNKSDSTDNYEEVEIFFSDTSEVESVFETEDWDADSSRDSLFDSIPPELLEDSITDFSDFELEQDLDNDNRSLSVYSLKDMRISASLNNNDYTCDFSSVHNNINDFRNWNHFGNSADSLGIKEYEIKGLLNDSLINYIQVKHGKGNVHLHLLPLAFTNYSMLDSSKYMYAKSVFSALNYQYVVWDEENKIMSDDYHTFTEYNPSESPLSFILSKRGLKWAWYGILICAVLYIIFGAKRTQRILPVEHPLTNSSLQFATTIGELYIQQKDHRMIAMLQWKLFLNAMRNTYSISTQTETAEEKSRLIRTISLKSGIELEQVEDLFESYRQITIVFKVSDEHLASFYNKLKSFYSQRK